MRFICAQPTVHNKIKLKFKKQFNALFQWHPSWASTSTNFIIQVLTKTWTAEVCRIDVIGPYNNFFTQIYTCVLRGKYPSPNTRFALRVFFLDFCVLLNEEKIVRRSAKLTVIFVYFFKVRIFKTLEGFYRRCVASI